MKNKILFYSLLILLLFSNSLFSQKREPIDFIYNKIYDIIKLNTNKKTIDSCFLEINKLAENNISSAISKKKVEIYNKICTKLIEFEKYKIAEFYLLENNKYTKKYKYLNEECFTNINSLGFLYLRLSNYDEAGVYFKENLKLSTLNKSKNPKNYLTAVNNLAEYYRELEDVRCFNLYKEGISFAKKINDTNSIIYSALNNNLSIAFSMGEEYSSSEKYALIGLRVIKRIYGEDEPNYIKAVINYGTLKVFQNNLIDAEQYLLFGYKKISLLPFDTKLTLLSALSEYYRKLNVTELQIKYYTELVKELNINIDELKYYMTANQLERFIKAHDLHFKYYKYLLNNSSNNEILNGQVYNNELQNKGIVMRSTSFYQKMFSNSNDTAISSIFEKIKEKNEIKYKLIKENKKINQNTIIKLDTENDKLFKELTNKVSINKSDIVNLSFVDIEKNLNKDEAAIEFINFNDKDTVKYGALVMTKNMKSPLYIKLFNESLLSAVLNTGSSLNYKEKLNSLYNLSVNNSLSKLIWQPIDKILENYKKIFIAPAGLLNMINFNALPLNDSIRISSKYEIHNLISTGNIIKYKSLYLKDIDDVFLYGGVNYIESRNDSLISNQFNSNLNTKIITRGVEKKWNYLAETLTEINQIDSLLMKNNINSVLYIGNKANESSIKKIKNKSSYILHIATHGYFFPDIEVDNNITKTFKVNNMNTFEINNEPLLRSGLLFAGANKYWNTNISNNMEEDGILTSYEVSNLNLFGAKLVILSACETGLGEIKGNEGVFGLQRSLKIAGVNNIIMSLWKVPDLQTKELMILFYNNISKGMNIHQSLSNAQLIMSKKYPPYYWGAFKLLE